MKKRITALALSALLFLSGCNSGGKDIVINADGYEGFFLKTENSIAEPVSIPSANTYEPEEVTSDSSSTQNEDESTLNSETDFTSTQESQSVSSQAIEIPVTDVSTLPSEIDATVPPIAKPQTTVKEETTPQEQIPVVPQTGTNGYNALNYKEVRGVWISYIELFSILTGKSETQFTSSIRSVFQKCKDMGLNTVYVHVRSHGDAFYESDYYPWSAYVTGSVGGVPSFDPLEIMVDEAHSLGLSFQAWINPFRLGTPDDMKKISSDYATGNWYQNSYGDRVVNVGSYCYLNPGYSEAIDLIANGAREIVANYDVDGVHIDDYFYPTTDVSFDYKSFSSSGFSSLTDYRMNNCDKAIKALYNAVKAGNSTALFGAAPQGNVQNNYSYMYADVKKWCSTSGYIDYIAPQIYFGFKNAAQPYEEVLSQWQDMVSGTNVRLIPGLAVYKIGAEDSFGGNNGRYEWITDKQIIKRQIEAAMKTGNYGGTILYSYNYVFQPTSCIEQIKAEMDAVRSLFQ